MELIAQVFPKNSQKMDVALRLISWAIKNDYALLLIKTRPCIYEVFFNPNLDQVYARDIKAFLIKDREKIPSGIKSILRSTWHKPYFSMALCDKSVFNGAEILEKRKSFSTYKLEKNLDYYVKIWIDPLDGELNIFADSLMKEDALSIFPEFNS